MFANPAELTNDSLSRSTILILTFLFSCFPLYADRPLENHKQNQITNENQIVSIALLIFIFKNNETS